MSYASGAACLVITLDTPGGLLTSTRTIVKHIMNAPLPVITYIAPSGSRAGSAGVFITLASHLSAMAPSTNIGAAHPINLDGGGGKNINDIAYELVRMIERKRTGNKEIPADEALPDERGSEPILSEKILNDTVAWVKAIAKERNKNIEWAEDAVRESISHTEKEALENNVIDCIAQDLDELLMKLNGRTVELNNGTINELDLTHARVTYIPLSTRQKILLAISHPNIAYILMMLGFYGLLFEITHPGIGFPGIAGAMCLIIAFFALSTLPINYAGLLLIILGIILFIAEVKVVSYGLLTLGGIVSMFLGSLMLIDSSYTLMRISLDVILPMVVATAGITIFLISVVLKAHSKRSIAGKEGLIGALGVADSDIDPLGTVVIHGEIWKADSEKTIRKGEQIRVVNVERLKLTVVKV